MGDVLVTENVSGDAMEALRASFDVAFEPELWKSPDGLRRRVADFAALVDACHQAGLAVWLDWVPGHFPDDPHGLGNFNGTALYEHEDPRKGEHPDWGTYIFNYGRNEVRNFLIGNALFWLREFHLDGLRVDAVA